MTLLVLTEMVELKDAIRWHDSGRYTALWAQLARDHAPDIRIYKYETWHEHLNTSDWLARIDHDAEALWEGTILAQAKAYPGVGTIHVIPAGRAMAAFARELRARGGVHGMPDTDVVRFSRGEGGPVRRTEHATAFTPATRPPILIALVQLKCPGRFTHADPARPAATDCSAPMALPPMPPPQRLPH